MREIPRNEEKKAPTGMQSKQAPASPENAVFTKPACAHCLSKLYLVYALVTICQPAPILGAQSRCTDSLPPERLTITSGFLVGYRNSLQKYLQPVCHTALPLSAKFFPLKALRTAQTMIKLVDV